VSPSRRYIAQLGHGVLATDRDFEQRAMAADVLVPPTYSLLPAGHPRPARSRQPDRGFRHRRPKSLKRSIFRTSGKTRAERDPIPSSRIRRRTV